jgi:DnaJ-class molecular chaperone
MKNFKVLFFLMAFAAFGMTLTSCAEKKADASVDAMEEPSSRGVEDPNRDGSLTDDAIGETVPASRTRPEYTSAWVCPNHCEGSGSDSEDKCPKCETPYVRNADAKITDTDAADKEDDGHNHDHDKLGDHKH